MVAQLLPLLKIRVLTPRPVVPGEVAVVAVPRVGVYVNARDATQLPVNVSGRYVW